MSILPRRRDHDSEDDKSEISYSNSSASDVNNSYSDYSDDNLSEYTVDYDSEYDSYYTTEEESSDAAAAADDGHENKNNKDDNHEAKEVTDDALKSKNNQKTTKDNNSSSSQTTQPNHTIEKEQIIEYEYDEDIQDLKEKRIQEHREYRRKLAEDPSFVPYLGLFWSHDDRYREDTLIHHDKCPPGENSSTKKPFFSKNKTHKTSLQKEHDLDPLMHKKWDHSGWEELLRLEEEDERRKRERSNKVDDNKSYRNNKGNRTRQWFHHNNHGQQRWKESATVKKDSKFNHTPSSSSRIQSCEYATSSWGKSIDEGIELAWMSSVSSENKNHDPQSISDANVKVIDNNNNNNSTHTIDSTIDSVTTPNDDWEEPVLEKKEDSGWGEPPNTANEAIDGWGEPPSTVDKAIDGWGVAEASSNDWNETPQETDDRGSKTHSNSNQGWNTSVAIETNYTDNINDDWDSCKQQFVKEMSEDHISNEKKKSPSWPNTKSRSYKNNNTWNKSNSSYNKNSHYNENNKNGPKNHKSAYKNSSRGYYSSKNKDYNNKNQNWGNSPKADDNTWNETSDQYWDEKHIVESATRDDDGWGTPSVNTESWPESSVKPVTTLYNDKNTTIVKTDENVNGWGNPVNTDTITESQGWENKASTTSESTSWNQFNKNEWHEVKNDTTTDEYKSNWETLNTAVNPENSEWNDKDNQEQLTSSTWKHNKNIKRTSHENDWDTTSITPQNGSNSHFSTIKEQEYPIKKGRGYLSQRAETFSNPSASNNNTPLSPISDDDKGQRLEQQTTEVPYSSSEKASPLIANSKDYQKESSLWISSDRDDDSDVEIILEAQDEPDWARNNEQILGMTGPDSIPPQFEKSEIIRHHEATAAPSKSSPTTKSGLSPNAKEYIHHSPILSTHINNKNVSSQNKSYNDNSYNSEYPNRYNKYHNNESKRADKAENWRQRKEEPRKQQQQPFYPNFYPPYPYNGAANVYMPMIPNSNGNVYAVPYPIGYRNNETSAPHDKYYLPAANGISLPPGYEANGMIYYGIDTSTMYPSSSAPFYYYPMPVIPQSQYHKEGKDNYDNDEKLNNSCSNSDEKEEC
ncbi:uncharacterized protein BX663DRAFT_338685 [Cokeromyces recurvatus]|uniref:uncharacterized protein n=1 Tax=Cokeromyces recurvatus TaxID=90255 RepID=UPI002220B3B8|nr:uncharacterized protein BX663DRAFT_338685 [Cokeromyces recurvatus]KAI7904312.1 hypothetical protein BX663DRAFT_338685 [Cokeromyces recurvatus]